MTEAEWLTCEEPKAPLRYIAGWATDRKLRLFAVACCRLAWYQLATAECRRAVELSEEVADDPALAKHLSIALEEIHQQSTDSRGFSQPDGTRAGASYKAAWYASVGKMWYVVNVLECVQTLAARSRVGKQQLQLLRDIFGNPFRRVTADPAWLTSTVVELARGIYDERAFDRLPILADALQDAGCDSADVLDHCRGPGPHVRGCWVVDLVLGKA